MTSHPHSAAEKKVFISQIKVGHSVPDFHFQALLKNKTKKGKLSDYRGQWLVLFFYPADFTFICPTELEEMADHYKEYVKHNTEVLSVSTDKVETHKAWHDTSPAVKKVEFPMVADPNGRLSKAFGVYIEDEGVALRGTFLIDPDGVLKAMEVHDNSVGRSARELFRKLQAAQYVSKHGGQVCPASWEPGKETLKPGLDIVGKI